MPASSNGFDNSYSYPQSSSSTGAGVGQSPPLTNGSGYGQPAPQLAPYTTPSQNQSMQHDGSYSYNGYGATPIQGEEPYNGYPNQSIPDHSDFIASPPFNQTNVPVNISKLSLTEENSKSQNLSYIDPSSHQPDFTYLQPAIPQSLQYQEVGANAKRQRMGDIQEDQELEQSESKEGAKPRLGACHRCKSLKVKCEFKQETDTCKRCFNGGHECFIPGRKKRRAPPKREFLLSQIREQAAQIQNLMSQLETTNKFSPERPLTPDILSPLLSPTTLSPTHSNGSGSRTPDHTQEAVAEWITRAKESLDAFGDHISMAGGNMPRDLLAGHDQEADDEDDGYYTAYEDDDDEVGIAVEQADDEEPGATRSTPNRIMNRKDSASSLNSAKKHGDKKAAIIPTKAAPFGLLGDMSLNNRGANVDSSSDEKEDRDNTGIASADFFKPASTPSNLGSRLSDPQNVPLLISRGLVTTAEAEALFKIYFDNMNISVSLLDPVLYTARNTFLRSPLLFTVICAISSRFYSKRPGLYLKAMPYAQQAAGTALISGKKTVDMCHAFILLSLYPVPAKKWEDQRSWLYLGVALRVATELNLHLPVTAIPNDEKPAREVLNRTRVWLNCFNLDRSTGGQYGKPPTISSMDYQANHSPEWWRSSPYNMRNFDIHLCSYNHDLRTTANFVAKIYDDPENPTGLNKNADFEALAAETDDKLQALREQWLNVIKENTDLNDHSNRFRMGLIKLAYSYGRLIVLSYGFQHAFGKNNTDENPFLMRCLSAAEDVLQAVVNEICEDPKLREFWRHGPEAQSVFVTFASAFLVKLLQPKFASYLTLEKRADIRNRVQGAVDMLSSIAVDHNHGPRLYAKFLKGLLDSPKARLASQSPATSISSLPRQRTNRKLKAFANPASPNSRSGSVPQERASMSPPPHQDANSFDSFAPLRGASDPYAFGTDITGISHNATSLDMSDLFNPPLSNIDSQIMDNLAMIDAPLWNSSSWLSHFQTLQNNLGMDLKSSATDVAMQEEPPYFLGSQR